MKALLVTFEFGDHVLGGLGRVINGVTAELRHRVELDVYLLYANPARLAISAKVYRCDSESLGSLTHSFTRGYAESCVELIRREKYDVVHFFSVHWIIGNIIERLTRELPEQKIVYSVHSLIKYEEGTRKNPRSFFDCERKLIESASIIQVLNHTTEAYFKRAYAELAAEKSLAVIGNGISESGASARDEAFRKRLVKRLRPNTYTVVCLSRWAHGKGLEYYVEAAAQLLASGRDVQFVLAGRKFISWEMQWYRYVAKITRMAWGLGPRFLVLGWLDAAQRNTLFELAHAVVMPSELEYYPYAVLEPVLAGVPLICSDLPCVRELLRDQEEYLTFESGDSTDLACQIAYLEGAEEHAREMAERARLQVTRVCDWKVIARDYERLYLDAVGRSETRQRWSAHESLSSTAPAIDS